MPAANHASLFTIFYWMRVLMNTAGSAPSSLFKKIKMVAIKKIRSPKKKP